MIRTYIKHEGTLREATTSVDYSQVEAIDSQSSCHCMIYFKSGNYMSFDNPRLAQAHWDEYLKSNNQGEQP